MVYKQTTPMQWLTFYYNGDDVKKIELARDRQMTRKIRYADVIEEVKDEQLEILSDTNNHIVGITKSGLIVMFENNISR